jgi:hypothetical protein
MNQFVEKNERFLRVCSKVAKFFGLFFIASVAFILIPMYLLSTSLEGGSSDLGFLEVMITILGVVMSLIFPAFLLLGIEKFIKTLIVPDFKPTWLLRHGDKIIYVYVIFLFISFACYSINMYNSHSNFPLLIWHQVIVIFIKILIWIGIAQILKRIMPIIKESKTLV